MISGSSKIKIGAKTKIYPYAILECDNYKNGLSSIEIGNHCSIHPFAYIKTYDGKITIGNYCSVHPYTVLYGNGGLSIGNNVRIAAHTVVIPANHNFSSTNIPIFKQGLSTEGIRIEDDVWIGAGVYILDGVTIEKGCVIGAGSIVTKSTEQYGVYVGNPAKKIKDRILKIKSVCNSNCNCSGIG